MDFIRITNDQNDPIRQGADRVSWSEFSRTVAALINCGGINAVGLEHLLRRMRDQEWRAAGLLIEGQHALMRHDIAQLFAAAHGQHEQAMRDYLRERGDLLPDAPESPASLVEG